jgi:hypothetical protein
MKKGTTRLAEKSYSVDGMMLKVASSLIRDFQSNLNDHFFCSDFETALRSQDLEVIRRFEPEFGNDRSVAEFKAHYQLMSILKRYRFKKDLYSDQELQDKAIDSFLATQDRLRLLDLSSTSAATQVVLREARSYIADVLGLYDDEECRRLCRFGRRASVGIPARDACEAARWELPISGSCAQIDWFDAEMREVEAVQEYWRRQQDSARAERAIYQPTDALKLTLVPKTFKSLRAIMPNTTIGSYMSFGLGEMIRKRLKRKGFDIGNLQQLHRVFASQASVNNMFTTADLSSASDSITEALLFRLLPSDWFNILNNHRIRQVELPNGCRIESLTFCTMGIGYTFPLQTLVFLSLLVAIQRVYYPMRGKWSRISVYGDDMIYPTLLHEKVLIHFQELGFILNVDKTYSDGPFRESCGGDYYRGVDVRPFQPRNDCATVGPKAYEAILYKYINGLLMRWSEYEIDQTLHFLISEVCHVVGKVKIVPGDFPDEAGVKCTYPGCFKFLKPAVTANLKHVGHGVYRFSYLRHKPAMRKETRHDPYLWKRLQASEHKDLDLFDPSLSHWRGHVTYPVQERIDALVGVTCGRPVLIEAPDVGQPVKRRKNSSRPRRLATFVTVSNTGTYVRQSGVSCFGTRS